MTTEREGEREGETERETTPPSAEENDTRANEEKKEGDESKDKDNDIDREETPSPVETDAARNAEEANAHEAAPVVDAEASLKERLKAQRRSRTQQQQQQQQPTQHVRIDYLQRPLTLRALLQWLGERCGEEVREEQLWLHAIKTHCYVSFDSREQAQRCVAATHGERFPETNAHTLVASFTTVSAKDALLSLEASLKPGEWKSSTSSSADSKNNNKNNTKQQQQTPAKKAIAAAQSSSGAQSKEDEAKRESRNAALKRKLSEATEGATPTANLFKRAAVGAILHTHTGAGTASIVQKEHTSSGAHIKKREKASQEKEKEKEHEEEEGPLRHTTTQPSISWRPVSDEVAQKRISLFKNRIGAKAVK